MELTVDFASTVPIYTQIRNAVIQAIADGRLKSSEVLPSVRALGSALGVNYHTVNKAYTQLADEGFITMRRGLGAMVAEQLPAVDPHFEAEVVPQMKALFTEAKVRTVDRQTLVALIDQVYDEGWHH
ncbi:MAG: GntR family transcriptional regulator [Lactobacillus sp.]|jgi:DNA-binding transcriptional regulator YhcF (GntR family)|uniref:GntR family transcriptional regulator n=1 Tax=Lacticaseibacillus suilingensis TaxID=2799577 RepID=A0ABW4BFG7_9LACO|nr:GntR family transcriptional regulator [Lacticaseibacillus suilingensis]MCI1893821.1 GntR family transcriptional regulator [Lactobacillus sp.]MCI1918177.1 GntR family transcriptional regulator [Lactobacillus sp.]MCI1941672.1 GntR family transcriptional regulator [Lactobacillus sp.]MCI1972218.1 GntR family transcriptional regulator [Lactobacillus sp.]MCI2017361.1 GntR family transcriptional regulator [Lactobacillus sp.]